MWSVVVSWKLKSFSEKLGSYDFCTSFAGAKRRRPLGGSSWKLLEFTIVSRFLAYDTRPHELRISVACGEKNLCEVEKCIPPTQE
jgi:hypothetical protein